MLSQQSRNQLQPLMGPTREVTSKQLMASQYLKAKRVQVAAKRLLHISLLLDRKEKLLGTTEGGRGRGDAQTDANIAFLFGGEIS